MKKYKHSFLLITTLLLTGFIGYGHFTVENEPFSEKQPENAQINIKNAPIAPKPDIIYTYSGQFTDKPNSKPLREKVIKFALKWQGTPYVWGGISGNGFDCSGFTHFVFSKFGYKVPHSSGLQANEGSFIKKELARRGDLIIFTGTNAKVRKPGHVGIIISRPNEPLRFVHASSNGGVKISNITDGNYQTRFMEIRRVL